jgi:hypothetical protein
MSADDCRQLAPGHVRFYDDYVPTIGAGAYLINIAQQIEPPGGGAVECHVASQAFSISSPRYALPPSDIFSVFPPEESLGNFDQFLPHVVLAKEDLPWERNVFSVSPQAPWMALLVFVADEKFEDKPALLPPEGASPNRTMTATISAKRFENPPSGEVAWPEISPEWYEKEILETTQCNVIDVSIPAFRALVPPPAELRSLVHVRQVDPSAKETAILKISKRGWYSVLVSKRLPHRRPQATRYIAHLVSLEGMQNYIAGRKLEGKSCIRMIAFKSWTFTCAPQLTEDFTHLMNGLLREQKRDGKPVAFRLPTKGEPDGSQDSQYAWQAIQRGYVPIRYQTRQGEETFGWYRSPFAPEPVKKFVIPDESKQEGNWLFFDRASAAMIYDKEYGVFDLSYAAAWEAGRLAALANGPFGQALRAFQSKGTRLMSLIAERQQQLPLLSPQKLLKGSLAGLLAMDLAQVRESVAPRAITQDAVRELVTGFSEALNSAPPVSLGKSRRGKKPRAADVPPVPLSFFDSRPPLTGRLAAENLLSREPIRRLLQEEGEKGLEVLADFLSELYLLMHIPFGYLVPHPDLLPAESVRFFHIDANWLDAALEGALSIGVESSKDSAYQKLMKESIRAAVGKATKQKRQRLAGTEDGLLRTDSQQTVDPTKMTGMLLRSALVSGWRGLEVHAYTAIKPSPSDPARPDPDSWIQPLRIDRLSDNVMLCIWGDVPAVVAIDEPHEGVAFGFEDPPLEVTSGGYYLYLRRLTADGYGIPFDLKERKYFDAKAKNLIDANSQLDLPKLQEEIRKGAGATTLNVRDFALEMVRVPQQGVFAWKDNGGSRG